MTVAVYYYYLCARSVHGACGRGGGKPASQVSAERAGRDEFCRGRVTIQQQHLIQRSSACRHRRRMRIFLSLAVCTCLFVLLFHTIKAKAAHARA